MDSDADDAASPPRTRLTKAGAGLRRRSVKPLTHNEDFRAPLLPEPLPGWIASTDLHSLKTAQAPGSEPDMSGPGDAGSDTAFAAGAAVLALDQIIRSNPPWLGCWRMRLVLTAAVAASRLLRLDADEAGLRDALHLTRTGDDPGPAGRLHLLLRRWATRPLRLSAELEAEVMRAVADNSVASEVIALLDADRVLATRLGWQSPLPLHLGAIHDPLLRRGAGSDGSGRPRAGQPGWRDRRNAVLLCAATQAHAQAVMLARRAEAVTAAAASLRTRDEGRGLALILGDDSVAPWRMAGKQLGKDGMGSDRAARRFCESLHGRDVLRLLTERPIFRLYGL
jgi:Protein of unknown function (DUF1403)